MGGNGIAQPAMIDAASLGRLMPMHLWISPSGHIRAAGPTIAKLCADGLAGRRFLEVFAVKKPRCTMTMRDFLALSGQRLEICLRDPPQTRWRGISVPLQDGQGVLVNLSFGIAAASAVREHALTHADFAPTDLTVELLYLTEVKAIVMGELAALNRRLQAAQADAEERALTDALTGLANRRALDLALVRVIAAARRGDHPFALMHVDLDFFKAVNDTLGHAAGDLVLAHAAGVLHSVVRVSDVVARVGGDEFVLLFHGLVDQNEINAIAARIIDQLERPVDYNGRPCRISASIGVTLSGFYQDLDPDRLLSDADTALYASKRGGRRRCTIHDPREANR
ncbi:MAG: GGDEF domain-containing protein [Rhodobacteraceae bacterium]|nr:GGDEF domain-containing protein [Paracoccaceae bacterium]MCP5342738.1 GGDEF domain-containing protein [Paracoccaceae bacterium]